MPSGVLAPFVAAEGRAEFLFGISLWVRGRRVRIEVRRELEGDVLLVQSGVPDYRILLKQSLKLHTYVVFDVSVSESIGDRAASDLSGDPLSRVSFNRGSQERGQGRVLDPAFRPRWISPCPSPNPLLAWQPIVHIHG